MLPVKVGCNCTIVNGPLKGIKGKVVSFDFTQNIVEIELGEKTYVTTVHESIEQE